MLNESTEDFQPLIDKLASIPSEYPFSIVHLLDISELFDTCSLANSEDSVSKELKMRNFRVPGIREYKKIMMGCYYDAVVPQRLSHSSFLSLFIENQDASCPRCHWMDDICFCASDSSSSGSSQEAEENPSNTKKRKKSSKKFCLVSPKLSKLGKNWKQCQNYCFSKRNWKRNWKLLKLVNLPKMQLLRKRKQKSNVRIFLFR
jgi:hypothetical protein